MSWRAVSREEYSQYFNESWTIFHSTKFNEINKDKVKNVVYLLFENTNCLFGICFGIKENWIVSPFSSPFGGIEHTGDFLENDYIVAIDKLAYYLNENHPTYSVQITLPPVSYDKNSIEVQLDGFIKNGFKIKYTDINFHLELNLDDPLSILKRNAKKNLKKALEVDYQLILADNRIDKERAYSIIQRNRAEKGYPLKMSFQDLLKTENVVKIDFFTLKMNHQDVAAAVVFRINSKVAMVVYWGHLYEFSEYRPVNLMGFLLVNFYKEQGFQILDIGPSSENGILDEGLASFKESLGCVRSNKFTLIKSHE